MLTIGNITFSGAYGLKKGQKIIYITERCVFELSTDGMELKEVAPGIDLQKDILDQMDFQPVINAEPELMDTRIFQPEPMGLADGSSGRVVNLELLVPKEFKEI